MSTEIRSGESARAPRICPGCLHQHVVGTTCLECPGCGYDIDLTDLALAVFEGDDDVYTPGSFPRFDDADRYFRAEGCTDDGAREYHWFVDCAWLLTALAHDARLVISDEPPVDAAERGPLVGEVDPDDLPRLCRLCARLWPVAGAVRPPADKPCATCGCPPPAHVAPEAPGAQRWCRTGWTEVAWTGPGPDDRLVTLLPCRCDGYRARWQERPAKSSGPATSSVPAAHDRQTSTDVRP